MVLLEREDLRRLRTLIPPIDTAGTFLARMEDREEEEEVMGSSLTMEKVAAAKQFIENHYRAQMKNIQERKER